MLNFGGVYTPETPHFEPEKDPFRKRNKSIKPNWSNQFWGPMVFGGGQNGDIVTDEDGILLGGTMSY